MKIRPVGTELFHADGKTDKYDETSTRFPNFANATANCNDKAKQY
jgi:hypothetical protein